MYEDVGSKIKSVTKVVVIIMMILSCIGGFVLMIQGFDMESGIMVISGIFAAAIGCGVAWLAGLTMYAYGEITESLESMNYMMELQMRKETGDHVVTPAYHSAPQTYQPYQPQPYQPPQAPAHQAPPEPTTAGESLTGESWFCTMCGTRNSANFGQCKKCGKFR